MQLPRVNAPQNKIKPVTVEWKGLNKMPVVSPGQLLNMTNMSSKYAPCLSPRPPREEIISLTSGTSFIFANGKWAWVDGTDFLYDGVVKGAVTAGRKSMCIFNGVILILPDKKYYDYTSDTFGTFTCPDLDYVTVYNNRVVGVKGNDFRISALGKYDTWEQLAGENTDSWATDTAEEGDFSGLLGLQTPNHIIATKKGFSYELYGNKPSNYNLTKIDDVGCIDFRSLVAIDNIAYCLSSEGIMQYAGSNWKNISIELQEKYVSGAAGTDGRRYYISLYNGTEYNLYVYDTFTAEWHREDNLEVQQFFNADGFLYALTSTSIIKFNSGSETVNFSAETERFTEQYNGAKAMSEFSVLVEIEGYGCVRVYYSVDGADYILADTILSSGFYSYTTNIKPKRGNAIQLKFEGFCEYPGSVKVYQLDRKMTIGSTVAIKFRALTWDEIEKMTWNQLEAFSWDEINHRRTG
jgi:hypothetical protein